MNSRDAHSAADSNCTYGIDTRSARGAGDGVEEDHRPDVPFGSPEDWHWADRNEWGFEGWVPDGLFNVRATELWSNYFAVAVSFGTGSL